MTKLCSIDCKRVTVIYFLTYTHTHTHTHKHTHSLSLSLIYTSLIHYNQNWQFFHENYKIWHIVHYHKITTTTNLYLNSIWRINSNHNCQDNTSLCFPNILVGVFLLIFLQKTPIFCLPDLNLHQENLNKINTSGYF